MFVFICKSARPRKRFSIFVSQKSVVTITREQNITCKTHLDGITHEQTTICRQSFACQVAREASWPMKERKKASNDKNNCLLIKANVLSYTKRYCEEIIKRSHFWRACAGTVNFLSQTFHLFEAFSYWHSLCLVISGTLDNYNSCTLKPILGSQGQSLPQVAQNTGALWKNESLFAKEHLYNVFQVTWLYMYQFMLYNAKDITLIPLSSSFVSLIRSSAFSNCFTCKERCCSDRMPMNSCAKLGLILRETWIDLIKI